MIDVLYTELARNRDLMAEHDSLIEQLKARVQFDPMRNDESLSSVGANSKIRNVTHVHQRRKPEFYEGSRGVKGSV